MSHQRGLFKLPSAVSHQARLLWSDHYGPQYCSACQIDICTNPDIVGQYDAVRHELQWGCNCASATRTALCITLEWVEDRLRPPAALQLATLDLVLLKLL